MASLFQQPYLREIVTPKQRITHSHRVVKPGWLRHSTTTLICLEAINTNATFLTNITQADMNHHEPFCQEQ